MEVVALIAALLGLIPIYYLVKTKSVDVDGGRTNATA